MKFFKALLLITLCSFNYACSHDNWEIYKLDSGKIFIELPKGSKVAVNEKKLSRGQRYFRFTSELQDGISLAGSITYYPDFLGEYDTLTDSLKNTDELDCTKGELTYKSIVIVSGVNTVQINCFVKESNTTYDIYQLVKNRRHMVIVLVYQKLFNKKYSEKVLSRVIINNH